MAFYMHACLLLHEKETTEIDATPIVTNLEINGMSKGLWLVTPAYQYKRKYGSNDI